MRSLTLAQAWRTHLVRTEAPPCRTRRPHACTLKQGLEERLCVLLRSCERLATAFGLAAFHTKGFFSLAFAECSPPLAGSWMASSNAVRMSFDGEISDGSNAPSPQRRQPARRAL